MATAIRFEVLGVVRATAGGDALALGGPQQRMILAVMLVQPHRSVGLDELVDAVWESAPPRAAAKSVQIYVHRLRRVIGQDRVVWEGSGYRIVVGRDEVDAAVAEDLIAEGRAAIALDDLVRGRNALVSALDLWRGPAFADLAYVAALQPAIAHFTELRLHALEDAVAAMLAMGDHREAASVTAAALQETPLRERLRALHMTALFRSGRPAEAIASFHDGRQRLADDLGLSPSPLLEQAHLAVVRGDDPGPRLGISALAVVHSSATISQLPPDATHFTGRDAELRAMDVWAERAPLLITGGPGVGKTALAVHWGRRYAARTGADHLYVDLRGHSADPPLRPIDALTSFLWSLGVPGPQIPVNVPTAAAMYRSALAGRRVVVLLDNAFHAQQVRDLIPGGDHAVVIVTSRERLAGSVARDGAHRIALRPLSNAEALALLGRVAGPETADCPELAAELARLCGHLPLALRVAAANLTDGIDALVREMAEARWPTALDLHNDETAGVRAAFDHSYQRLSPTEQRLFRLLSTIPSPSFSAATAEAVAQHPAAAGLRRLVQAHLVEAMPDNRFRLHDLVQRYAEAICGPAERADGQRRLYNHALAGAAAAATAAYPHALRLPADTGAEFPDAAAAFAWLDAERDTLLAVAQAAAADGEPAIAWRLADQLRGYFAIRKVLSPWLTLAGLALPLAEAAGDVAAQIAGRISLSLARWYLNRDREAIPLLQGAVELAERIGWNDAAAAALNQLGIYQHDRDDLDLATACLNAALDHRPSEGIRAVVLGNLGHFHHHRGRLDHAIAYLSLAAGYAAQLNLGLAYLAKGDLAAAHRELAQMLAAEPPDDMSRICAQAHLALIDFERGQTGAAADRIAGAMALIDEIDAFQLRPLAYTVLGLLDADPDRHGEAIRLAHGYTIDHSVAEATFWSATTLLRLGDLDAADAACAQVFALTGTAHRHIAAMATAVSAEIHAARGDAAASAAAAREALMALSATGCLRYRDRMRALTDS